VSQICMSLDCYVKFDMAHFIAKRSNKDHFHLNQQRICVTEWNYFQVALNGLCKVLRSLEVLPQQISSYITVMALKHSNFCLEAQFIRNWCYMNHTKFIPTKERRNVYTQKWWLETGHGNVRYDVVHVVGWNAVTKQWYRSFYLQMLHWAQWYLVQTRHTLPIAVVHKSAMLLSWALEI
jgi:hypothetical protein